MKPTAIIAIIVLALAALAGCSYQQQSSMRGELTRRDIYLNLMTPEQATRFRLMEAQGSDDEHLLLYCQETGVYQRWRAVPPEAQQAIRQRRVVEGMSPEEVQMSWGKPAAVEDSTGAAERQAGHQRTLWNFDPAGVHDGVANYNRQACFLDDKLLWFKDFREKKSVWQWFNRK